MSTAGANRRLEARLAPGTWPRGESGLFLPAQPVLSSWVADPQRCNQGLRKLVYRSAERHQAAVFVLESRVESTVEGAQAQLVAWLGGIQSPTGVERMDPRIASNGDIGFAHRLENGASTWIAFVRGNVAVKLDLIDPSHEPVPDLDAIARLVDGVIRRAPVLEDGAPARARIETLALPLARVRAGAVLPIECFVPDPAGGEVHLRWIVGGPGQGYVERAANGRWELHTTGRGELRLVLEATTSLGTWTRREVRLNVLED